MTKLIAAILVTAALSGLITYTVMQDKALDNPPLSFQEQLSQNELTVTESMLAKDLLQPAFGEVTLVGIAQTNNCSTSAKGCFGDRSLTEEEFAAYTGRGPQISLLVYETELPITADQIKQLKLAMNEMSYSLMETRENTSAAVVDDGTQPLYSLDVSVDIGDTQIRAVIRPIQ
ncbi:MAG: hypothetical protein AAB701_02130 [Patescibacteria group bacterium]